MVGAVHIAQAVVPFATGVGFAVTVVDPRRSFASDERFPNVTIRTDWPDEALDALRPDARTAVVTLTHDPKLDDPALDRALRSPAFYIGSLGSRRTHAARLTRLRELGHDDAAMARIRGPVGLDLEAVTAPEIALSIVAELVAVRRGSPIGWAAAGATGGMKFGPVPLAEAKGAINAHSQRLGERMVRKGSVLDEAAIVALREAGRTEVIAARLDPGDVPEDIAADRLADPLVGRLLARSRAATGRVNLAAETPGLLRVDAAKVNRINAVDESLTLGTLPDFAVVAAKDLVATIKIVPFAVPGALLEVAEAIARQGGPALTLHPFRPLKVGLVVTELPGTEGQRHREGHRRHRRAGDPADRHAAARAAHAARGGAGGRRAGAPDGTGGRHVADRGRLGSGGQARRRPGRHRARRGRDPAFRDAGRSGESDLPRADREPAGAGAARLRQEPQAERHRLSCCRACSRACPSGPPR